jgi:non-homologous end joining protein Ku
MHGEDIAAPEEPVAEAPVIDLMEALKASVAAAKQQDEKPRRTRKAAAGGGRTRSRAS